MNTPVPEWLVKLNYLVLWLGSFGMLIPLSIGMRHWRHISLAGRSIIYYCGFWSIESFVDLWSRKVLHTNIYLYHVSVLVETWLLGWAYYQTYDLKSIRRIMPWIGVIFTCLAFAEAFWFGSLHQLNRITRAAQVVLMLVMILLYFEQWTRETHSSHPWRSLMFLTSTGLAVYYTGSVMGYMLQPVATGIAKQILGLIIDGCLCVSVVLMTMGLWREQQDNTAALRLAEVGGG